MGVAGDVIADANTSTVTTSIVQDSSADVMSFVDEVPTQVVSRVPRPLQSDTLSSSLELSDYLGRWTFLQNCTWASTNAQGAQLMQCDPWYLFLTNTAISKKLAGFRRLHATLHVRFVISGAATQFGMAVVAAVPQGTEAYTWPYVANTPSPVINDTLPNFYQIFHLDFVGKLYPSKSNSVEFDLPWNSPADAIDLMNLSNSSGSLGGGNQTQWRIVAIVAAALGNSTNMSSIASNTIRCFARLTDVNIDMPYPQSGVPKGKQGVVGRVAGAVSSAAASLKDVPVIATFARGTEIVASAIGAVADFFGFTRLDNFTINPPGTFRSVGNLVNGDGQDYSVSLSVLSGNKVSIDPALGGAGSTDHMSFADMSLRKHYHQSSTTWTTSQAPGTVLATWAVTPVFGVSTGSSQPYSLFLAPVSFVAAWFEYWRGSMEYFIEVVASAQHRGRLQLVYYPYTYTATEDATNSSYNRIWEVNGNCVKGFRIGWSEIFQALRINTSYSATYQSGYHNGYLQLVVQTELTSPDPTASVNVLIFGRGGSDMQFFRPIVPAYLPASGSSNWNVPQGPSDDLEVEDLVPSVSGDISAVVGGETVQSIRTLLQRPILTWFLSVYNNTGSGVAPTNLRWSFGLEHIQTSNSSSYYPPENFFHALSTYNTPLRWFTRAFLGFRGSRRFKLIPNTTAIAAGNGSEMSQIWASLGFGSEYCSAGTGLVTAGIFSNDTSIQFTDGKQLANLEVRAPYFSQRRYNISRLLPNNTINTPPNSSMECITFGVTLLGQSPTIGASTSDGPFVNVYESAGEDFSYAMFRFVPLVYSGGPLT